MTTPRRVLSGVAAAVVIAAVLVGIPAALITQVGWPLPETLPDPGRVVEAIQLGAIDPTVMANLLAIVVWVVWVQLAWALLAEIAAVARRTPTPRLPVLPGLQRTAASLVTTATLLLSSPTAPLAGPMALDDAMAATPAATQSPETASNPPTADPMSSPNVRTTTAGPTRQVVATARTSWWSLAEQHLGDGARWHQIRGLNIGRTMPDGDVVSDTTDDVKPDWTIRVPTPDNPPTAAPAAPAAAQPADTSQARPDDPAAAEVEEMGEWTVEPGDHMWEIAEETLEDELGREPTDAEVTPYWRSVIEANRDNLLPPDDPDLIYPGQVLDVPPVNVGQDLDVEPAKPADTTSRSAPDRTDTDAVDHVEGGGKEAERETAPSAGDNGQSSDVGGDTAAANGTAPSSAAERTDIPDQVRRDELAGAADRPAVGEPSRLAPTRHTPAPSASVPPADATAPAVAAGSPVDQDESSVPAPALAGGGLLAAALIAILSHRRWWHARRRKQGTTPPPAPDSRVARMLHAAADPTAAEMAKLVLRDLAAQLDPTEAPPIAAVYLAGRTINVLFDAPHRGDPPHGWRATDDWQWTRDLDDLDAEDEASTATLSPLPALVSVGADGHGGLLLVDLERATVTNIVGAPDDVAATMTTLALELAGSDLAAVLEVVCVGFGAGLADDLLRVRHVDVDDIDQLVAELDNRPYPDGPALGPRLDGWGDTYSPVVVIDPTGSADLAACARRHPAAVLGLVTSGQPGEWTLTLDGVGHATIDSPGGALDRWELDRPDLDLDTVTEIAALLAEAGAGDIDDHEELADTIRANPIDIRSRTTDPTGPKVQWPPVVVRILGGVHIEGSEDRAARVPSTEMIAYLALHPGATVSLDTLSEMMWPGLPPQTDRIYRISADARRILGTGADGQPRMPHAGGNGYTLTDEVGTDLAIFEDLVDQASQLPGDAARRYLRTALDLVDGEPFAGAGTNYAWAQTGPAFTAAITVEQAASSLGELYLDEGDTDAADWAARQGLKAMPGSERLYAVRLRAAASDTRRLEMLMREVTAVLGVDDGPDSDLTVPDELQQLHNELIRPQRAAI